jgi:hypothetical protein
MIIRSLITPTRFSHAARNPWRIDPGILRHRVLVQRLTRYPPPRSGWFSGVLIRPQPGFYVLRRARGAPLVPALIYQICPMVVPQPGVFGGPHPDEWCRPLDRSTRMGGQIDGKETPFERVWTARALRRVSAAEYRFRLGLLRHWARSSGLSEARPRQPVRLAELPPLF